MLAATEPRSGREAVLGGQASTGFLQPDINLNAPRYFVQLGFQVVSVGTNAIPNAELWRGEIVPCTTIAVVDNIHAIPETERIPGSERVGFDGRPNVASRRSHAHYEAEALLLAEDKADKKSCIFEIKSLYSEVGHRVYRELDITRLFFPTWPRLPEKNDGMVELLQERLAFVKANPPEGIPSELAPQVMLILEGVGNELIEAARRTQTIQRQEILYTHQCMKLRPNEERYKPRYDSRDLEILSRTGLPQIDAAEIQTASALEKLTDTSLNGSTETKELIALMRQQNQQQGEIIQMLLAERQGAKAEADPAPKNNAKK